MKRSDVLKGIMLPLAVILAVVLSGCENNFVEQVENPVPQAVDQGYMVGPDGGMLIAMDGAFVLTIPAGAVTDPVKIFVRSLMNKSVRDYALKTIVIEPLVVFKSPAQLTLKSDGCLSIGCNICEAKSVSFLVWDDEIGFIKSQPPKACIYCNVNKDAHTVCMCICQTGVIATDAAW
jgi:hypothetical protein